MEEILDALPFQHDMLNDEIDSDEQIQSAQGQLATAEAEEEQPEQEQEQEQEQHQQQQQQTVFENNVNEQISSATIVADPNQTNNNNSQNNNPLHQMQAMLNQMVQVSQPSVQHMSQGQILSHFKNLFQRSFGVPASSASTRVTAGPSSSNTTTTAASKAQKRPLLSINSNAQTQKPQAGTSSSKVRKTGNSRGRPPLPRDENGNIIRDAKGQNKENNVEENDQKEDE
jgi:hypothetical protein